MNTCVPRTAVLEMTYACNHACLFCSVPWESPRQTYEKRPELSICEWKNCIDILIGHGVETLAFTGGEPLMKAGVDELIRYAAGRKRRGCVFNERNEPQGYTEKALSLSLVTNGELIDERWLKLIKECRMTVTVSLPGYETFHRLTGGGDLQKVLKSIRLLSDAGIDIVMGICVTKANISELFETIAAGFLSGAKQLLLNRFLPGGRGLSHMDLMLDKDEVLSMLDIAEEACVHANSYGSTGTEMPKCLVKKKYTMLNVSTQCSGGEDFFAIDPSGHVRPCNHSPLRLGTYRDIPGAISSDYWQRFKRKDFLPGACRGCMHSIQCDAGCREAAHLTGGALDSPDPLFQ